MTKNIMYIHEKRKNAIRKTMRDIRGKQGDIFGLVVYVSMYVFMCVSVIDDTVCY